MYNCCGASRFPKRYQNLSDESDYDNIILYSSNQRLQTADLAREVCLCFCCTPSLQCTSGYMDVYKPPPLFPLGPCSVYGAVWERSGSAGVSQGAGGPVWTADPGPRGGEEESGPPCHQPLSPGPPSPPHTGNTPHLNPSNPHPDALKGIYCMPSTQHPNWIIPSIHHSSLLWLRLFSTSAQPTCVPVCLFASSLNVFVDSFSKSVSWNHHPLTHWSLYFLY